MDTLIQFLIDWGYVGIFLSAFLAGSIIPFSSEAVLLALILPDTGLSPVLCILFASLGNFLGSLTCYWMGHLGKMIWLEKYFHMKREKIERMRAYLNGKGSWVAFFTFLPLIGDVIAVALGFLRSNLVSVSLYMLTGKVFRYTLVVLAAKGILSFFI